MQRITIFDSTLMVGGAAPTASMTAGERLRMAQELDELGVDVLEVGLPGRSPDDHAAVRGVARQLRRPVIAARARPEAEDIDRAAEALSAAERPRLHTFLATSDLRLSGLGLSREAGLERIHDTIARARRNMSDVEFTAVDATRTDPAFLCRAVEVAVEAGATTINLPDTAGSALPADISRMLEMLLACARAVEGVTLSVHCRDDLGLAVANSLAAVQGGARQVHCTLNGVGARAGNAALEELVMALRVRQELGFDTGVRTERLGPATQLLAHTTGLRPPPHKAIVGEGVFAHEVDVHEGGALENPTAYEILTPEMVGVRRRRLVLGRHSGRRAMLHRLRELGYELEPDQVESAFEAFRQLAERQKTVLDEDLLAIYYQGTLQEAPRTYVLERLHVECGSPPSRATVAVREGNGPVQEATAEGDGPIDAAFAALQEVVPWEVRLEDFQIQAASSGRDALGEARLHLRVNGHVFTGRAASMDIVDAAARAFLNAVDKAWHTRQLEARSLESLAYWGV